MRSRRRVWAAVTSTAQRGAGLGADSLRARAGEPIACRVASGRGVHGPSSGGAGCAVGELCHLSAWIGCADDLGIEVLALRGYLRPRCRDRTRDGRKVQGGAQGDLQRRGQATRAWRASAAAAHEAFAGEAAAGLRELRPRRGSSDWRALYRRCGSLYVVLAVDRHENFSALVARAHARVARYV